MGRSHRAEEGGAHFVGPAGGLCYGSAESSALVCTFFCTESLQKSVRGAGRTATVADRQRTYGDRKMQSAIDRRHGHVYAVME
jgi:hypothetical protein